MPVTDLWGDISNVDLGEPSVVRILKDQADILYNKTHGLVSADVVPKGYGSRLEYEFVLESPYIEDYRYILLRVRHSLEKDPPIHAITDEDAWTPIADGTQFERWLAEVLQSAKTISKIRILMDAARTQQS